MPGSAGACPGSGRDGGLPGPAPRAPRGPGFFFGAILQGCQARVKETRKFRTRCVHSLSVFPRDERFTPARLAAMGYELRQPIL